MTDPLAAIYAGLPRIDCQRKCWRSCGTIPVHRAELVQIRAAAFRAVSTSPFLDGVDQMVDTSTGMCPHLSPMRECEIHEARPLICRLFGIVDIDLMRCPWGCVPERWLSDAESRALLEEVRAL